MIEREAGRLRITAPMTLANARGLLEAGRSALQPGDWVIDLAGAETADSSALAVMLGLLRSARELGSTIRFAGVPDGVMALAALYGVVELLSLA